MRISLYDIVIILLVSIHAPFAFAGWEYQNSGITGHLSDVTFIDEMRGWAVGDTASIETRDGGKTWTRIECPVYSLPSEMRLITGILFLTHETGFMGTTGGRLFRTYDGGVTWKETVVYADSTCRIRKIRFVDQNCGWVIVSRTVFSPLLFKTSDGGNTWCEQFLNTMVIDVRFIDAQHGWATGGMNTTEVYETANGGDVWKLNATFIKYPPMHKLSILSEDKILAYGPFLAVSTDGGKTWSEKNEQVSLIAAAERNIYWQKKVENGSYAIQYTEDGGTTFTELYSAPLKEYEITAMSGLRNGMLWAAGRNGLIMKYTPEPLAVYVGSVTPGTFVLYRNTPNPFNARTTIRFYLPSRERVKLTIYDITGRTVRILADGEYDSGIHSVSWDGIDNEGRRVSSGMIFYALTGRTQTITGKMIMIK